MRVRTKINYKNSLAQDIDLVKFQILYIVLMNIISVILNLYYDVGVKKSFDPSDTGLLRTLYSCNSHHTIILTTKLTETCEVIFSFEALCRLSTNISYIKTGR